MAHGTSYAWAKIAEMGTILLSSPSQAASSVDALVTGHFEALLQHPEHCGSHIHRTLGEDPNITPARCVTVAAVEHSPPAGGTAPVHSLLAEAELFRRDETCRDSQVCPGAAAFIDIRPYRYSSVLSEVLSFARPIWHRRLMGSEECEPPREMRLPRRPWDEQGDPRKVRTKLQKIARKPHFASLHRNRSG